MDTLHPTPHQAAQQSTIIIQSGVNSLGNQHRPLSRKVTNSLTGNKGKRQDPFVVCKHKIKRGTGESARIYSVTTALSFKMFLVSLSWHSAHFTGILSLYILLPQETEVLRQSQESLILVPTGTRYSAGHTVGLRYMFSEWN